MRWLGKFLEEFSGMVGRPDFKPKFADCLPQKNIYFDYNV
jgi:hypothetical protein